MNTSESLNKLYDIYLEHRLAHAYLIETNDVEKCYQNVEILAKKLFCEKEYSEGCKNCNICNLIDKKNLKNYIVIEPDGKSIKKGQIDELKNICSTIPLFVNKNIYVIKYAERMNDTTYNKMLKFLEEPEENIFGFYITANKDNISSTILSRLEIIKDYYEIEAKSLLSDEELNIAMTFINKVENKDEDILWYNETVLTKAFKDKTTVENLFKYILEYYLNKANKDLFWQKRIALITKYMDRLNYNANSTLTLNSFVIEMGDL